MKVLAATLGVLILSIFVFNDSMAQKANYSTHNGWIMGVGGGYAYQKSDLPNSRGFGFDFTLGRHLYYKENAFLSVDWKFRFLGGRNTAYDHRINPDDTYSNIRYKFFNYDLELGLTLNRLRERTGIVLTGFVGAGLTHGRTFTDLYDTNGSLYDFSSIDPNRDSKLVYEDLVALSDGDFETSLVNKAALLPTAGIFLGYQLSRSLTLGIEYKTNFYLTEENGFFGINLDNKAISGSGIDRNNYVSMGIRWNLRGGSSRGATSSSSSYTGTNNYNETNNYNNTTVTNTQVVVASSPHPSVNITQPSSDPHHTTSSNQSIRATINNVSGPGNIRFFQNGFPVNIFSYNVNTKTFIANVRLREGENNFRIQATNQSSSAEDLATITLDNPPEAVLPAPTVTFTSPSGNQHSSSADWVDVTASVKNISSKENIYLSINGINAPFEYNAYSGIVRTSVQRTEETSNLLIEASNETGSAQDQLTILFTEPEEIAHPTVRFIDPLYPVEVNDNRFPLNAATQNVFSRNDLDLKINGINIDNFSFNADGVVSLNLLLSEGVNTIEIIAYNDAGMAEDRTSITYHPVYVEPVYVEPVYYEPQVRIYPPVIHIIRPLTYPFRTYDGSEELRATVLNVHSKENIILNINGNSTRNFSYNNVTKELITRISLREGENLVTVHAQNESGGDAKDLLFIKETRYCPSPAIRLIDPVGDQISTDQQTYELRAEIRNITNANQLRLSVNGKPVSYRFNNNMLSSPLPLVRGLNTLSLKAANECGEDNASARITYNPTVIIVPCNPPSVAFSLEEVNREDATHELVGSVSGVKNKSDISLTLDGKAYDGFQFIPSNGELKARFKMSPGSHTIIVVANNSCGTDNQGASVSVEEPCNPPTVAFTLQEVNREDASHELMGSVSGVKNKSDISLTLDGNTYKGFQFVPSTGELSAKFKLSPGQHTIAVSANNACGSDHQGANVTLEEPCSPPTLSFTLQEVNREDASHELNGSVTEVKNKGDISLILDGKAYNGFQFVPSTGELSAKFKLSPGSHNISVSVRNACGSDSQSSNIAIEEPCNPPTLTFTMHEVNREDASHELRGSVTEVKNKSDISIILDGKAYNGFQFVPSTGELSAKFKLSPGSHTIAVSVNNACGTDSKSANVSLDEPCSPPTLSFTLNEVNREDASHELTGSVTGVKNKSDISITLDGKAYNGFQFVPSTGELSAKFKLSPGSHSIAVSVNNDCGTDSQSANLTLEEPCSPPTLNFTLHEVNREDASHELSGSVTEVKSKGGITMSLDGKAYNEFQFVSSTGELSAKFKLSPGSHSIAVSVNNDCGTDTKSETVTIEEEEEEEEECGIRINPGNSAWQFCLVTPSGTYSRENLTDANFSYSGSASSIYFKPIGGGGEATVNGEPYAIRSGQYYLFTGSLTVSVSTSHPGSMGHWSVCISASSAPVSGTGNNRPESPCESKDNGKLKGAGTNNEPGDSTNTRSNSGSPNRNINRTNTRTSNGSNNATNTRTNYRTNDRSNNATNTRSNYRTNDRSNNATNTRTSTGSNTLRNTRTSTGSNNPINTRSNDRTNNRSNNATNTRTNYRTDDKTKKSTDDGSVDSTDRRTNTRTPARPNNRSDDNSTGRTTSRTKR